MIIVDDLSTGDAKNLAKVIDDERLEYIEGSIDDESLVEDVVSRADRVYHLAAAVGVALIAKQPIQTIERNVYPTQLILNQLGKRLEKGDSVPCFFASTSEVYGKNPKEVWCEEDDLVFGALPPSQGGAMGFRRRLTSFWRWLFSKKENCP